MINNCNRIIEFEDEDDLIVDFSNAIILSKEHNKLLNLDYEKSGHTGFVTSILALLDNVSSNESNAELYIHINNNGNEEKININDLKSRIINTIDEIPSDAQEGQYYLLNLGNGKYRFIQYNSNNSITIYLENVADNIIENTNKQFISENLKNKLIALPNVVGYSLSYVGSTGVLSLLDNNNNVLSSVDLPLELLIDSGYYDNVNKQIVLVLANGDTINIPIGDILTDVATQTWVNTNYYNKTYTDNNYNNMYELTYAAIQTLKNNSQLIPGAKYRITDYVTKTNGTINNVSGLARSQEHPFDIIVTAISNNKFSEVASAILHEGDTYFANSNLKAWKLWYCFENDNTRFEFADTSTGKGVIYRLIDEFENDLPYDFKNIQFKRYKITSTTDSRQSGLVGMYLGFEGNVNVVSDSTDYEWYYTFTKRADNTDLSLVAIPNTSYNNSYYVKQVVIGQYLCDSPSYRGKQALNDIVFITTNVVGDIKIDDNSNKNTLVGNSDITYDYIGAMFRRNIIVGEQSHNKFGECFEENVLGNGTLTTLVEHIRTANHFAENIVIAMSSCSFETQATNAVFPNQIKFCNFNGYVDTVTMNGTNWWNTTFMSIARATITLNAINYCQISGDTFTLTEGVNNRTFYNLFIKGIANNTTINLDTIETALGTTIQTLADKTISWSRGTSTNSVLVNFEMRYVDTNGVVDNYTVYSKDFGTTWIKAESPYLTDSEMQTLIEGVFE